VQYLWMMGTSLHGFQRSAMTDLPPWDIFQDAFFYYGMKIF